MGDRGLAPAAVDISHDSLLLISTNPQDIPRYSYGFRHGILIREPRFPRVLVLLLVALRVPRRRVDWERMACRASRTRIEAWRRTLILLLKRRMRG